MTLRIINLLIHALKNIDLWTGYTMVDFLPFLPRGDSFYDFLFTFLHTNSLRVDPFGNWKERMCSPGEQILFF